MTEAIIGVVCFAAGAVCYKLWAKRLASKIAEETVNLSRKV